MSASFVKLSIRRMYQEPLTGKHLVSNQCSGFTWPNGDSRLFFAIQHQVKAHGGKGPLTLNHRVGGSSPSQRTRIRVIPQKHRKMRLGALAKT
jgi:hypothetical protein